MTIKNCIPLLLFVSVGCGDANGIKDANWPSVVLMKDNGAECLAISADGEKIAGASLRGSDGGLVSVWDMESKKKLFSAKEEEQVYTVMFSPDGKTLAYGGIAKAITLVDTKTWKKKQILTGQIGHVNCLVFSPDGKILAWASFGGKDLDDVVLWDLEKMEKKWGFKDQDRGWPCLAFSPDGEKLVSGGKYGRVIVWDVGKQTEYWSFDAPENQESGRGRVDCLEYSQDGQHFVTSSASKEIIFWNVEKKAKDLVIPCTIRVHSLALSRDGKRVFAGAGEAYDEPGEVRVWHTSSGNAIAELHDFKKDVRCIALSPDGKTLITSTDEKIENGIVQAWDISGLTKE